LALELGADYIEPDLVGTKDGRLVVMHSIDLNITTDVAEVFPDRVTTLPNNDTGYFAHEFTLDEIQRLKVRQRLPTARTQLYDGIFGIPTFQQALDLLDDWNSNVLPLLTQEPALERAGVYVELKDPELYQQVTNKNMVDLFLNELQQSKHATYLQQDPVCDELKFDQYVPPPLVVQCFSAPTLEQIHKRWQYNTSVTSVLLYSASSCFQPDFWFEVGQSREYIKGIGVEKSCLLEQEEGYHREFMTKAEEYNMAVHVWVERRELSELSSPSSKFHNLQQELKYLYCNVGIHGVFTENVATAVLVGQVGCDKNTTEEIEQGPTAAPTTTTTTTANSSTASGGNSKNPTALCYASENEKAMYVGVASAVMGLFVGCIVTLCTSNSRLCRKRGHRQLVVPTHDELEMI
jgi:glycerophosphoryl diester phosphodiesterase